MRKQFFCRASQIFENFIPSYQRSFQAKTKKKVLQKTFEPIKSVGRFNSDKNLNVIRVKKYKTNINIILKH